MLSEDDLREIHAATVFGKRRVRFFMRAWLISFIIACVFAYLLVRADMITFDMGRDDSGIWVFLGPVLGSLTFAELLKHAYSPTLLQKVAHEFDVSVESLQMAEVDLSGG